jgi:predicted O-linked N-acetylglucosamine transferase (SPINDLY family)
LKDQIIYAHSLYKKGAVKEAIAALKVLTIDHKEIPLLYNLIGVCSKDLGQLEAAVTYYKRALKIKPDYIDAHNNLGNALVELGQLDAAVDHFEQALKIKPDCAEVYNNLGIALRELGQLDAAVAYYERALKIKPDYISAHNNLGNALRELGQLDAAVACLERTLKLKAGAEWDLRTLSNLLFSINHNPNYDSDYHIKKAREYGKIATQNVTEIFPDSKCLVMPKRLRVGLVSGDLNNHPVGNFLEGMLAQVNSNRVELIAYNTNIISDSLSERIKPYFSSWKSIYHLSNEVAARLVYDDGIHVLIDLSGHTAHNRLPVFASRPAPVQVSWLGYFATTGLNEIDYLLGDNYVTPINNDHQFTEKIYRLPETRWCFTPPNLDIQTSILPAFNNGYVTFGCFNRLSKLNDQVIGLWVKILAAVPNSRLLLKAKPLNTLSVQKSVIQKFTVYGIDAKRIILEGSEPPEKYLAAYHKVDIALDPFPFTGGATSVEGLWMGVPVLTLRGNNMVSNQGVGILMNAGLPDWVAKDEDGYVAKAISFSSDLDRLASLRSRLREQLLTSPLFNAESFARNFEDALWDMWQFRKKDNKDLT